jgi:hypothetical protein
MKKAMAANSAVTSGVVPSRPAGMRQRFSSVGAPAERMNRSSEFRTPEKQRGDGHEGEVGHRDAREQHGEIVVDSVSPAWPPWMTSRTQGMKTWARIVSAAVAAKRTLAGRRRPPREQLRAFGLQGARIGGHEGRGEGAFGENAAEEIRELLGRGPGVADRPGADLGGEDDVAREAEDAAGEGQGRLNGGVANQAHVVGFS